MTPVKRGSVRACVHRRLMLFRSRPRAGMSTRKVLEGSGMVFAAVFLPGRRGSCGRCRGVGMASESHRTGGQDRVLVLASRLAWETVLLALGLQALWGPCGGPAGGAGAMGRAQTPCCGRTGQKAPPPTAPPAPAKAVLPHGPACAEAQGPSPESVFSDGDARGAQPFRPLGRAARRSQSSKARVSLRPPSRPSGHAGPGPSPPLHPFGV